MNIKDIMYQTDAATSMGKSPFAGSSMLAIGGKGQVVEGVISGVSDKISINFNGIEVSVPHSAVRGATEGETRKFQIMDVSKENIVLKEVGRTDSSGGTRAMVNTTIDSSAYNYSSYVKDSAQAASAKQEAGRNIAVLTGEDYQSIEEEEGAIEKYQDESLDRAIERVKEQKAWEQNCQEMNNELRMEFKEGIEKAQAEGFLDNKSRSQIEQVLRDADIPVTDENIVRVTEALKMSLAAGDMSDDAKAYIVGKGMTPTIENIYHGQYSGSDAFDGEIYDTEVWQELKQQIGGIIQAAGLEYESAEVNAKWLLANDLPVTAANLKMLDVLQDIKDNMTPDRALMQIVQAMSAGSAPEQASLDTSEFIIARAVINDFMSVTDRDIAAAVNMVKNNLLSGDTADTAQEMALNLELLKQAQKYNETNIDSRNTVVIPDFIIEGMTTQDILAVTAKRHIAEICLKMTMQSVNNMYAKGINVETAPLEEIVKELRDIENEYYRAQSMGTGDVTDDELDLMQEALKKTYDIANAPASVIGKSIKQVSLITFNELHAASVSETAHRQSFMDVYERVATSADSQYGDSIQKAFESIPDILKDIGMEDTKANERAVRILGYNGMEITAENINAVKEQDSTVNRIIENMKPSVVLELIRDGSNPLNKTISELDNELKEIVKNNGITSEDKYSKYLWQLERDNAISDKERDGYIGVYRLLNNIEKTDGAAIGAVMQADREMTLGNLLTAVRTIKNKGMDVQIDNNYGGLSDVVYSGKSISEQINTGFSPKSGSQRQESDSGGYQNNKSDSNYLDNSTIRYYDSIVNDALDDITPSKLGEIADGDMEKLLNTSLEKFAEDMKQASGNKEIEKAYYDRQAELVRKVSEDSAEAAEYLDKLGVPTVISNLGVAEKMLEQGYNPVKECYNRKNVLDEQEREDYEEVIENIPDALDDEESIKKECERAEKYMQEILSKSYQKPDISSEELNNLRFLGHGIQLNGMLAERRSYDIPIKTGDTITNMNVIILNGYDDKGKVQISMENTDAESENLLGSMSAEFKISGNDIKGLILCSNRSGYDKLSEADDVLKASFEKAGCNVKNISYGMGYSSRSSMLKEKADNDNASTADLYTAAKVVVKHITGLMKELY